ncbi:MAG: glycoside hydrolase family 65 protein [Treponema sp.]|jgi:trehalose/maltose hydrolase-like predicted phosphorylase|nr:glycoside hydrolase family 65 protein [Treponema sp.]
MYHLSDWEITDDGRTPEDMLRNGNRLLTGNGYLGRRGVSDDADLSDMPATVLSGLYDRHDDLWREPVNAPDPLFVSFALENGNDLKISDGDCVFHEQALNFRYGIYSRHTVWRTSKGAVEICEERYAHSTDVHCLCARYRISATKPIRLKIIRGIRGAVRDLNGPHLGNFRFSRPAAKSGQDLITGSCETLERGIPLAAASGLDGLGDFCFKNFPADTSECMNKDCYEGGNYTGNNSFDVYCIDGERLCEKTGIEFFVFGVLYTGLDLPASDVLPAAEADLRRALDSGWELFLARHREKWDEIWRTGDVVIQGDDYAQQCLRYSLYHLHIIMPRHRLPDRNTNAGPRLPALSVSARGLSGQTYKGAVFWDTEMFISPYFLAVEPDLAAQFIRYRIETLPGARRKAAEYGYRGAFYAWESQETGDDACSDFNVTDVFTGRPVRTYFRDKQIHISADIVYAVKKYVDCTGDFNILKEGAMEVILEAARFFISWLYYSPDRKRYEILDVIGPDEYHERVHNNAFTNRMVLTVFETAQEYIEYFRGTDPGFIEKLLNSLAFSEDVAFMKTLIPNLYVPCPGGDGVIEQFDGYFKLEDCAIETVRSRLKDPREYWGGGNGVAAPTRIIKQADVVTMLCLFKGDYPMPVKKANLEFYESRTEHGSSLSACMYALLACETGDSNRAYPYFIKSAEIDIIGQGKHFAGLVYIGGTHPAASGGAWMTVVRGFCGLSVESGEIRVIPRLPEKWEKVIFQVMYKGIRREVTVTQKGYSIS